MSEQISSNLGVIDPLAGFSDEQFNRNVQPTPPQRPAVEEPALVTSGNIQVVDESPAPGSTLINLMPEEPANLSKDDEFMKTIYDNVASFAKKQVSHNDNEWTYNVVDANDQLNIMRFMEAGYEMAVGHPDVSEERNTIVLKRNRAWSEAFYEKQVKDARKRLMSSPNIQGGEKAMKGEDFNAVFDALPEKDYVHTESMQALIDQQGDFDPNEQ